MPEPQIRRPLREAGAECGIGESAVSQTVQARHDRTLMSADLYNKGNLWEEMGTWTIVLQ